VSLAVNFHGKLRRIAVEIEDVRADRVLPAKVQVQAAQCDP
jgi:hypothetical protein